LRNFERYSCTMTDKKNESDPASGLEPLKSNDVSRPATQLMLEELKQYRAGIETNQKLLTDLQAQFAAEEKKHAQVHAQLIGEAKRLQIFERTARADLRRNQQKLRAVQYELERANAEIDSLRASASWRTARALARFGEGLPPQFRRLVRRSLKFVYVHSRRLLPRITTTRTLDEAGHEVLDPYERWVKTFDTLSDSDREAIREDIVGLRYKPLISVIMPVYETPEWALTAAIDSVRNQLYPHWELCIADDASMAPHIAGTLRRAAKDDSRIRWIRREKNGHISAASNSALSLASGEFVALMDHDDLLSQHALYEVAVALNKSPSLDIIYSDEDQIDASGRRQMPYFKTDWNIDLLLGHNMISHLGVYRRALLESVGGFREGFEGSQDYDVALRCADATVPDRICHIPTILYHRRRSHGPASFSEGELQECSQAALRAISEHLDRCNELGEAKPHPVLPHWSRVIRPIPTPAPLVSLIVPTRDRADLLGMCVNGLLDHTDYPAIELLIVDHASERPETFELFDELKSDPRVRILPYSGPFNYSAMNNMAVAQARGSIVGLVNNDIDVINSSWLSEMVALAILDDVGAVGAKLLFPDGRVQHAGVVLGVGGAANYFNHLAKRSDVGYFGRNVLTSSVSAVTAACLIVRKSVFDEVGGLNEADLAVAFNDIDFCLKVMKKGYRNVWTPHAELYHHESASRGAEDTPEKTERFQREIDYMWKTWGPELAHDPFYNDNFSLDLGGCFQLAFPPRRQKPWKSSDAMVPAR
jgi:GT2 family glycosyltransferase